mmetsp:Transcript_47908/g.154958  ORF Transcript_47908/g.154958 Transcript_47908/m.154958 type:complete len:203 (+) Transcript_47908:340-948(+)
MRLGAVGRSERLHPSGKPRLETRASAWPDGAQGAPDACLELRRRGGGALKHVRLVIEEGDADFVVAVELVQNGKDAVLRCIELCAPGLVVSLKGAAHRPGNVEQQHQGERGAAVRSHARPVELGRKLKGEPVLGEACLRVRCAADRKFGLKVGRCGGRREREGGEHVLGVQKGDALLLRCRRAHANRRTKCLLRSHEVAKVA